MSCHASKLQILFPFVEWSLFDILHGHLEYGALFSERETKPIENKQALELTRQLLSALSYLHAKGLAHRNIKPKHLLITPEGASLQLAGFSFVRSVLKPARKLTADIGTRWYRSPEVLMGSCEYDQAVDVWSAGCVHAEMLLGSPLFDSICQTDQVFQVFALLGSPHEKIWPGVTKLPHWQEELTPSSWRVVMNKLSSRIPRASASEIELLAKMLTCCPERRVAADRALLHPLFRDPSVVSTLVCQPVVRTAPLQSQHLGHLMQLEADQQLEWEHFLSDDKSVRRRAVLMDWLVAQTVRHDSLCERTLFAAASLLDRVMLWDAMQRMNSEPTESRDHIGTESDTVSSSSFSSSSSSQQTLSKSSHSRPGNVSRSHSANSTSSIGSHYDVVVVSPAELDLRLLGVVCLHLASKTEDTVAVCVERLLSNAWSYDLAEVLLFEQHVLVSLDFTLTVPLVVDFLGCILYDERVVRTLNGLSVREDSSYTLREEISQFSVYLAELSLFFDRFKQYRVSLTSQAVLGLTCELLVHSESERMVLWEVIK
eukprot:gene24082-30384_t